MVELTNVGYNQGVQFCNVGAAFYKQGKHPVEIDHAMFTPIETEIDFQKNHASYCLKCNIYGSN